LGCEALESFIYKDCKEKTVTLRKVRIVTVWCGRKEQSDGIARNKRPGIEDIRRYKKALVSKAFLLLNANGDAKFVGERYDIASLI
jgi:hypothetical protein